MRLTSDQLMALADLAREHGADEINVGTHAPGEYGARLDVDLYRDDEQHFSVHATIDSRGKVRQAVTV